MKVPIEDHYEDIIGKAASGLGLDAEQVAREAGVSESNMQAGLDGFFDENIARSIAPVLGLNADALVLQGKKTWYPEVPVVPGVKMFTTHFACMLVNAYVVWDPKTAEGVIFDTGAEADGMLDFIRAEGITVSQILLTHSHHDHVAELGRVKGATGAEASIAEAEALSGADTFRWGDVFSVGGLRVDTRETSGHSAGGTTFVISGLDRQVAIVGDAVFAGSMGGGRYSYSRALETNRGSIMTLAGETLLCPGHGPMTTVGQEREVNPFLAG